mgnify:CR=1 FL=1
MKQVKYILVNETVCKNAHCDVTYRDVPHIGHCAECFAVPGFKVQGSRERQALIDQLCKLRRHWPEAPILGVSELPWDGPSTGSGTVSSHAPIRVSEAMNALRREISDYP